MYILIDLSGKKPTLTTGKNVSVSVAGGVSVKKKKGSRREVAKNANKEIIETVMALPINESIEFKKADWKGSEPSGIIWYHAKQHGLKFSVKSGWGAYKVTRVS